MNMSWFRTAALCAAVSVGCPVSAQEPAKIHAGLHSADGVLKDMEYLTVKLAKQKGIFEKNIKPNIEIFLIGVNPKLPVGMSLLFTEDTGQRKLMQIPVEDLKADFIDGNLVPIGIDAEKDRKDKTLYALTGATFNGWMRAKGNNNYASISDKATDVPVDVASPDVTLNALFTKGLDFAALSQNTEAEAKVRAAAIKKLKENRVSALKKKSDESQEAFDLRKLMVEQQMDSMAELFSETQLIEAGWTTSEEQKQGIGQAHLTAMPNTVFAKWVAMVADEKSQFASLVPAEKSVFSARALLPLSDTTIVNLSKIYELAPTVIKQLIEKEDKLTPGQKSARIAVADVGLAALNKSLESRAVDVYLDIAPSEGTFHSFVLGMRSIDNRERMETIVTQLGLIAEGWSSKTNIEAIGETKIHSFTVAKPPQALLDFYGGDGTVYVAAGPTFVGFATGVGSLDGLKKVVAVASEGPGKSLESFVDVRFRARETLSTAHAFMQEKDFDLLRLMQKKSPQKDAVAPKAGEKEKAKKAPGSGSASDRLSALQNFDWQQTAIDAMQGTDDVVTIQLKLVNGAIDAEMKMNEGVLTGLGAVIAKFAKENLGGN